MLRERATCLVLMQKLASFKGAKHGYDWQHRGSKGSKARTCLPCAEVFALAKIIYAEADSLHKASVVTETDLAALKAMGLPEITKIKLLPERYGQPYRQHLCDFVQRHEAQYLEAVEDCVGGGKGGFDKMHAFLRWAVVCTVHLLHRDRYSNGVLNPGLEKPACASDATLE